MKVDLPEAGGRSAHLRNALYGFVLAAIGAVTFPMMKYMGTLVLLGWIWFAVGVYGVVLGARSDSGLLRVFRIPFVIAVGMGGAFMTLMALPKV